MKSISRNILLIGLSLLCFGPVHPAHAQTATAETQYFTPDIRFPGVFGREPIDNQLMGKYIRGVYVYMVYVVSVLAVVMIVFGGVKWVAAAGNAGAIRDAKDVITNAIIGLIIALTSFLLLYVIKPQFLNLDLPEVHQVSRSYFTGAKVIDYCDESQKVKCGELREITEAENFIDSTYCIGLSCSGTKICNISAPDQTTPGGQKYLGAGSGCLDKIPFNPPLQDSGVTYDKINVTDEVRDPDSPTEIHSCGRVWWVCGTDIHGVQTCAPQNVGKYCENGTTCYMTGQSSTEVKKNNIFYANNIQCTRQWTGGAS